MQNLQPRAQDSALLGGTASISLEYQIPDIGASGGAIIGAETADFVSKKILRKLIRFAPGDVAFDQCNHQKWTILSYYFDLNGYVKYIAYNNIIRAEFFEDELQIERTWIRKNYLQAKEKTEYLESLSALNSSKNNLNFLTLPVHYAIFKFAPGDTAFDVYEGKKWKIIDYFIDLNSFTRYLVSDGNDQLEYLEDELQIIKPRIKQNCSLTETKDEYTKVVEKIDFLETNYSSIPVGPPVEPSLIVFKFAVGETAFDIYKKQRWKIVDSFVDTSGHSIYQASNGIINKQFMEKELQTEKTAMKQFYEEAEERLAYLQS